MGFNYLVYLMDVSRESIKWIQTIKNYINSVISEYNVVFNEYNVAYMYIHTVNIYFIGTYTHTYRHTDTQTQIVNRTASNS